ncbi:MAG: hypothetical protein ACM3SX_01730 [Deltaproteobacteria bacterium]
MTSITAQRVAAGIAGIVLAFTIQAIYWPILLKPGTELDWWQAKWAADVGYFVGAPAILALAASPFVGAMSHVYAWACALVWALVVFAGARFVLRRRRPHRIT